MKIILPTMTFKADFIVLELGNADIILGVQWLRTLGKCVVDWERNEWSLYYQGKPVTITGDPNLHNYNVSLKTLTLGVESQKRVKEIELRSFEGRTVQSEVIPSMMVESLSSMKRCFRSQEDYLFYVEESIR